MARHKNKGPIVMPTKTRTKILLVLRLVAACILLQTLFFKFTGAPESKFIFSTLGLEPWGRWFSGFSELIASILLLIPSTQVLGAGMALGIMLGAIASHLLILGIEIQNDGGFLFALALTVSVCSSAILFLRRNEILLWISKRKNLVQLNDK